MYNPQEQCWKSMSAMSVERRTCSCAVIGTKMYVIGGNEILSINHSCEVFDTVTETWSPLLNNMINPRWGCAATASDDKVYVFGGLCDKSAEVYDVRKGIWTKLPDMNVDRHYPISIAAGKKIYVLGGSKRVSIDIFDTTHNEWIEGPSMPCPLSHNSSATVIDNKIILFGGHMSKYGQRKMRVETFDIEDEVWETLYMDPSLVGTNSTISVIGKDVYVIDELNGPRCLSQIERMQLLNYDDEDSVCTTNSFSDSSSASLNVDLVLEYPFEEGNEQHCTSLQHHDDSLRILRLRAFIIVAVFVTYVFILDTPSGILSCIVRGFTSLEGGNVGTNNVIDRAVEQFMDPIFPL
jgi:hypothetical protein